MTTLAAVRELFDPAAPGATVVCLADVRPERVEWLWASRIPLGKVTVLDGDPGLGKSTITLDLGARVSTGRPMPGETAALPPAGVVLLSAEDGLADTIRPRLDAAGADVSRIVALTAVSGEDGDRLPTLPQDLDRLEDTIQEHDAALVVVDVLMAYLSGDVNAHRDQDVRSVLARLAAMADRTRAAVIVLRHLNKATGGPAIYRGGGSIGISGAARSALVVGRDPDDESRLVLAVVKSNLAATAPSLAYRIVDRSGVAAIDWEGASDLTASQLLVIHRPIARRSARGSLPPAPLADVTNPPRGAGSRA
jgi:RecA-family ATPase